MAASASDPYFFGLAPPAQYDLNLTLDYNTNTVTGSFIHSDYPSVQVFINNSPIINDQAQGGAFGPLLLPFLSYDIIYGSIPSGGP